MLQLPAIEPVRTAVDILNLTNVTRLSIQQFEKPSERISYCIYTCTSHKKAQLTTIFLQISVNYLSREKQQPHCI